MSGASKLWTKNWGRDSEALFSAVTVLSDSRSHRRWRTWIQWRQARKCGYEYGWFPRQLSLLWHRDSLADQFCEPWRKDSPCWGCKQSWQRSTRWTTEDWPTLLGKRESSHGVEVHEEVDRERIKHKKRKSETTMRMTRLRKGGFRTWMRQIFFNLWTGLNKSTSNFFFLMSY